MLYMFFPKMPGMAKLVHDSINWIRNGLLPDPVWEQLFYRALLYGGMTSQIFPKVYSLEELRQIKTPTLLLIGDREKIYRPQDAIRSAEKAVPTLRAEIIPNAHHIAALAQPEIVNQRIEQFFAEGKF